MSGFKESTNSSWPQLIDWLSPWQKLKLLTKHSNSFSINQTRPSKAPIANLGRSPWRLKIDSSEEALNPRMNCERHAMVIGLRYHEIVELFSWVVRFLESPGLCRFANTYKKCSSLSKQINSFAIMFFAFYLTTVTVWKEAVFRWNGAHTDFNDVMFCDATCSNVSFDACGRRIRIWMMPAARLEVNWQNPLQAGCQ